jgi:methanogenic corrinoid protein MtbC1
MTEQRVILDKGRFEDIFKFVMKAVRNGIPEDEIWATVEVMSSEELESGIRESEKEIREGRARRFRTAREAIDWLRS